MSAYVDHLNRDTLQHHGIKGQKHGVRNGPPYPLNPADHSAREKRAGREIGEAAKKASYMVRNYVQKTRTKFKDRAAARKAAAEREEQQRREAEENRRKEEQEARRKQILSSPKELYKYRNEFSTDEINKAIERFSVEKRLKDFEQQEMVNKIENGRRVVQTVVNTGRTALELYNLVQNIKGHPENAIATNVSGNHNLSSNNNQQQKPNNNQQQKPNNNQQQNPNNGNQQQNGSLREKINSLNERAKTTEYNRENTGIQNAVNTLLSKAGEQNNVQTNRQRVEANYSTSEKKEESKNNRQPKDNVGQKPNGNVSAAVAQRMASMSRAGYTMENIAEVLDVSASTVAKYLEKKKTVKK